MKEEELIDICRTNGIDEYDVTKAIKQLSEAGQIYEPKFGVYQLMG